MSDTVPSTPFRANVAHLSRLPSTPRTAALVEIRSRHALQSSTSLSISHFSTLLAELNAASELDRRIGFEQDRLDKIEQFREDYMTGAFTRVQPRELLDDDASETYSDGTRRSSIGGTTTASSSQEQDDPSQGRSRTRRIYQVPLDAVSRGIIAEKTIKEQLAAEGVLISHEDYASLARVARKAMKRTIRLNKPVYVSLGLLHSVDWTKEYRQRGWAAPGIRWGPFRPDLVKFEKVQRKHEGEEAGTTEVSWEIVEVKYARRTRDVIYTNHKVQAIYYHLTLVRLLSNVESLTPSHKVNFFISHDPLSPRYLERPLAIRTSQAFVEHHLFVLLPEWLRAVKETEWKRLQDKLAEKVQTSTSTSTVSTPGKPTFLEKLQASQRKPPKSTFVPRSTRLISSTPLVRSNTVPLSSPAPPLTAPLLGREPDSPPASQESQDSFLSAQSSLPSSPTPCPAVEQIEPLRASVRDLPPLPPIDDREEEELDELFGRIKIA
ncbi:hypothetical protein JCM16303_006584 [Sporobolomyces ruberrimus]